MQSRQDVYDNERRHQAVAAVLKSVRVPRIPREELEIVKRGISRGGFGVVHQARWVRNNASSSFTASDVAVKELISPSPLSRHHRFAVRFARELSVWCILDHPNILPCLRFNLDITEDYPYFVSPYMSGGNITTHLKALPVPSVEQRMQWVTDLTKGLNYLHGFQDGDRATPIVHGNLHPSDILINNENRAMICDFGLSSIIKARESTGLTTSDGFKGSICWCSPELAMENIRSTHSDAWAWALCVLEILTRRLPYHRQQNDLAVAVRIVQGPPLSREEYPELHETSAMWDIVEACLKTEPTSRATIQESLQRIELLGGAVFLDDHAGLRQEPEEDEICGLLNSVNDGIDSLANECASAWRSSPQYERSRTQGEIWTGGEREILVVILKEPLFRVLESVEPDDPNAPELLRVAYQVTMVERLAFALEPFMAATPRSYSEGVRSSTVRIVERGTTLQTTRLTRRPYGSLREEDFLDNIQGYAFDACKWCFLCATLISGEHRLVWDAFRCTMLPELEKIVRDVLKLSTMIHGRVESREYKMSRWSYPMKVKKEVMDIEEDDKDNTSVSSNTVLCTVRFGLQCSSNPPRVHNNRVVKKARVLTRFPVSELPLKEALDRIRHLEITGNRISVTDRVLGYGGFGDVRCGSLDGSMTVAVKALRPAGDVQQRERVAKRFAREISVWTKLQHSNIIPLLGFCLSNDYSVAWMISPLCAQGNARDYLRRVRPTKTGRIKLILDTVKGLQHLHESQPPIIHGDLKAGNVLIMDDIRAVLCDFGLAKVKGQKNTGLTTSKAGTKGTTRYFSPEVALKEEEHTLKRDMWAWGCLVLEMLLDLIPYVDAPDPMVYVNLHAGIPPADVEQLDLAPQMAKVMQKCWSFESKTRPSAAGCTRMVVNYYRLLQCLKSNGEVPPEVVTA